MPLSFNALWKPQQLAEFLGVPISFIYDRTCRGASDPIPRLKIGKYIRFDPDAVRDWLERHCDSLSIAVPKTVSQT
jgi:hypothetical protein